MEKKSIYNDYALIFILVFKCSHDEWKKYDLISSKSIYIKNMKVKNLIIWKALYSKYKGTKWYNSNCIKLIIFTLQTQQMIQRLYL